MLVYSNSFYEQANITNSGYDREIRDAICNQCGKVVGRQQKYCGIDDDWSFEKRDYNDFKYCPYCGRSVYR